METASHVALDAACYVCNVQFRWHAGFYSSHSVNHVSVYRWSNDVLKERVFNYSVIWIGLVYNVPLCKWFPSPGIQSAAVLLGSITSRCSGKEPALLPRTLLFSGRNVDQTRESDGNRAYSLALITDMKPGYHNWFVLHCLNQLRAIRNCGSCFLYTDTWSRPDKLLVTANPLVDNTNHRRTKNFLSGSERWAICQNLATVVQIFTKLSRKDTRITNGALT